MWPPKPVSAPQLRRQLGFFDATMIVMGGIVGSGIFINPYVVARHVHTPLLILGVWMLGGALAMLGAFIWAELATRLPDAGGQYLYLREAYHPAVAFLYGWVLLLVTQTGGMAAVAVTFARYFREITGLPGATGPSRRAALLGLTAINCLGVRAGSNVQSALMLLRAAAIAAMVVVGLVLGGGTAASLPLLDRPVSFGLAAGHRRGHDPGGLRVRRLADRQLRRGRDARSAPRSFARPDRRRDRRDRAVPVGEFRLRERAGAGGTGRHPHAGIGGDARGAGRARRVDFAVGIAVSTLGFLSQGILTAPRVYYAMARDGLFFESVGWLSPRTGAPVVAIVLQGILATVIAVSGRYEQILNYVISVDFISFALTAAGCSCSATATQGRARVSIARPGTLTPRPRSSRLAPAWWPAPSLSIPPIAPLA